MTGADEKKLEEKIKKWIGEGDSDVGVKGHVSSWDYYSHLVHNFHKKWLQCLKDSTVNYELVGLKIINYDILMYDNNNIL